jgi:non-ribosomal peptide synthetase component F
MAELVVGQPQTLGFALRGAFVILRDENGDEADAGEICIGGTGVALGYFQDEARTEQSFITYRGERLYCTGDYGRMSFAGVVFAGRKDSLVKNRGFLINLETEVEPLLLDIPAVEIGIAVSVETRLYAFVCPASTAIGLRDDLLKAGKSPFLVPDRIVGMDNLPLTSNGKIDRKELIALLDTSNSPTVKPDPHEELGPEEAVSKAFSVALKLPESQITPVSSFRQLGGSSLAAVSVVTTIKRYSFATSLSQIFQMDTVAAISQSLTRIGQGQPQPKLDIARQELWKSVNDTLQTETDGIVDVAPMTDLQMRMIHGTLQDRSANYLRLGISFAHGSLSKLKRSWLCALAAHSSLRTTFLLLGERGAQLIHQQVDPSWEELPVQELPTEEEWRNLQYLSTEETLSTPSYPHIKPFIGFRVYSAPHGATLVTLTIHHSLIDGWSAVNLIESFSQAADGCLPSLPRPEFHQFIKTIDQSHFLVKEKAQAFWKENLGNLDPIPRLTLPVPSTPNSPAKRKEVCVSLGTTSAKLESQSLRARVTPAVFLYAAWSIVLSTYSASDEVVVGATLAGRSWPISEIESAVGPFVNTLPLRVQIDERESSERFLQTVFTTLCQISDYQGSTNSLIQTATGEKATEFYETIFALQYDFPPLSSWKSDTIAKPSSFWTTDSSGAKLNVLVEDSAEGLVARLVYHTDSFTTSAVEGMGRHLQNVLEAFITQDLSEPVSRIRDQLLKPTEIDALVRSFPRFNDQYVGAVNLKEAFESMVDRVPDFPALESPNGEVLTYRELDRRSNAVALEIMRLDSKSPFVAVQADGSVEWIVAIFATIKTGYAYCPIDVKYGRDRQKVMLDLAESDIIIYSTADSIPSDSLHPGLRFLTVDTIVGSIDEIKPVRFQTTISGESIAALIFTSGSTGVPKGKIPSGKF